MKFFIPLVALALTACQTAAPQKQVAKPNVAAAYSSYAIALENAADWAESDHGEHKQHVAGTVKAMADFNDSPAMTKAVDHAEAFIICTSPTPHRIPDYDCNGHDFSENALKATTQQLNHGSYVLRQGTYNIKDMHGGETRVDKGTSHDAH